MKTTTCTILLLGLLPAASCCAAIWSVDLSGDWLEDSNWDTGIAPNSNDSEAIFDDSIITNHRTVFTDAPVTVHRLEFASAHKYVLAGLGRIQLARPLLSTAIAEIDVSQGDHELQLPVTLNADTDLNIDADASVAINGTLDLNGRSLIKSGSGTATLNSGKTGGNGGTVNLSAGILAGAGAVDGDLAQTGGMLQVGNVDQQNNNFFGTFKVNGNYTQSEDGVLEIDLGANSYDVVLGGVASLNGQLKVSLVGFKPVFGDRFKILDFTALSAGFGEVLLPDVAALPAVVLRERGELTAQWDCSQLQSEGVIIFVPEPSSVALVLLAQFTLAGTGRSQSSTARCRPPWSASR